VLAVGGSHWLQAGVISPLALLAGAAIGLPAAAVLLVNNLRDLVADRRAGRLTLAAVLGDRGARHAYALLMLLPYASLPLLATAHPAAWLALGVLPVSLALTRRLYSGLSGPPLNRVLARTALTALLFAVLLALGILIA